MRTCRLLSFVTWCLLALSVRAAWPLNLEAQETALAKFFEDVGPQWVVERDDNKRITTLTGQATKLGHLSFNAKVKIIAERTAALRGVTLADFRRTALPKTPGTTRIEYQQMYGEEELEKERIENARIVINYDHNSSEFDVLINAIPRMFVIPRPIKERGTVIELAKQALLADLRREGVDTSGSEGPEAYIDPPESRLLAFGERLTRVYRVVTKLVAHREGREIIIAWRDYDIDAGPSEPGVAPVVRMTNRIQHVKGRGHVFDPNPRNTLNRPLANRVVPERFPPYKKIRLLALAGADDGRVRLHGDLAQIVNRDGNESAEITAPESADFSIFAGGEQFAAVMAYYHVHELQKYARRIGFGVYRHVPLELDVNHGGTNYYTPDQTSGHPYIGFDRANGIFVAEDADVIAHEYAHMLLQVGGEGRFATGSAEAPALNEGFADYWAMSTFSKQTARNGHCLACFAEWMAGPVGCERRLDEKSSVTEFDQGADVYENGKIWSAILFQIFLALRRDREAVDQLVLKGHINRAPFGDAPTMASIAAGIAFAARRPEKTVVCEVFRDFQLSVPYCNAYVRN